MTISTGSLRSATNLTGGRHTCHPTPDPITDGYRQLLAAVVVRAARDALHVSDPTIAADAWAWLARPETRRLAEVVGLLPEGGGR